MATALRDSAAAAASFNFNFLSTCAKERSRQNAVLLAATIIISARRPRRAAATSRQSGASESVISGWQVALLGVVAHLRAARRTLCCVCARALCSAGPHAHTHSSLRKGVQKALKRRQMAIAGAHLAGVALSAAAGAAQSWHLLRGAKTCAARVKLIDAQPTFKQHSIGRAQISSRH